MSTIKNDNISITAPKALDNRTMKVVSGASVAFASTAEANAAINISYRYKGLTTLIGNGSNDEEYWYHNGVLDVDLVKKNKTLSSSINFTTAIPFDAPTTLMSTVVTGALIFTINATGAQGGYGTIVRVTSNGVNIPNIDAFKLVTGSSPYINVAGVVNVFLFWYDGAYFRVGITQDATEAFTESELYFNRVNTAGGSLGDPLKEGISTFVQTLKFNNLYNKAIELFLFSGGNQSSHLLGFKNTFNGIAMGALYHNQEFGTAGDGFTGYIKTGIIPSSVFTLNSVCVAAEILTQDAAKNALHGEFGSGVTGSTVKLAMFYARRSDGDAQAYTEGNLPITTPTSSSLGRLIVSRTSPTVSKLFKNGVQIGSTLTTSSSPLSDIEAYIESVNFNGTAIQFSNRALSFIGVFSGLSDSEVLILDGAMAALKTAIRPTGTYSIEANLYFLRNAAAGGSLSSPIKTAINTFINTLKATTVWLKAEEIFLMCGGTSASHALGLKGNKDMIFNGSFTHTQVGGSVGDGTAAYARTGIIPLYAFVTNSVTLALDVTTDDSSSVLMGELGSFITGAETKLVLLATRQSDGSAKWYAEGDGTNVVTGVTAGSGGRYIGSRTDATHSKLFKNGTQLGSTVTASTGAALADIEMFAFAINHNGTADQFSSRQLSFIGTFSGLSDAEVTILDGAMSTLKTAIRV